MPWALGLNVLQRHNRLLGMLGRGSTPDTIPLGAKGVPIPDGAAMDPDGQRMRIWEMSEPALRPNWDEVATDRGAKRPVLHRVSLTPDMKLNAKSWKKLWGQLRGGGLFEWSSSEGLENPVFRRWLSVLLSRPTLDSREEWFARTFAIGEHEAELNHGAFSLVEVMEEYLKDEMSAPVYETLRTDVEFAIWAAGIKSP